MSVPGDNNRNCPLLSSGVSGSRGNADDSGAKVCSITDRSLPALSIRGIGFIFIGALRQEVQNPEKVMQVSSEEADRSIHSLLMYADSSSIGSGSIGGKASGLTSITGVLEDEGLAKEFPAFTVGVPSFSVIATDYFDDFIESNSLVGYLDSGESDEHIAAAFLKGDLSANLVGHLWGLISGIRQPLAVRSSSMLEDSLEEPFAGVYQTKMIPNNQASDESRFRKLIDAIKLVYASTFFKAAREYSRAVGVSQSDEKMAVIIQEVMGRRYGQRFYPAVSGVARSFNYYAFGDTSQEDGVVDLALGLGKTIVDGEASWSYCPRFPGKPRPFGSIGEMLDLTQKRFWAVNMGPPPEYDPIRETEYLTKAALEDAEYDDTLRLVASTYDPASDRIFHGTGREGPRIINFAPILQDGLFPLNDLLVRLIRVCERSVGCAVEIEFAVDPGTRDTPSRFGLLQVRPMAASFELVEIGEDEIESPDALVVSSGALGNGTRSDMDHVVFVKPGTFERRLTPKIASEITNINRRLSQEGLSYVLIGFGRWGSTDPWLGIPVTWGQISNAGAIVEITGERMSVELSQGSHFFHNITAFGVCYLSVSESRGDRIDMSWLEAAGTTVIETENVRCTRLDSSMTLQVDGRTGRGVILRGH
jgi:hypothetical protein